MWLVDRGNVDIFADNVKLSGLKFTVVVVTEDKRLRIKYNDYMSHINTQMKEIHKVYFPLFSAKKLNDSDFWRFTVLFCLDVFFPTAAFGHYNP